MFNLKLKALLFGTKQCLVDLYKETVHVYHKLFPLGQIGRRAAGVQRFLVIKNI